MQKIDRLGWAAGVCIKAYGWRIGIRTNQPEALERVMACLPPDWEPSDPPFVDYLVSLRVGGTTTRARVRNFHILYSALRMAARTMELDEVYDTLESELQMLLAEHARDRVFVHAGVVGWKGRAIVLPAHTWGGKSTLVAALLRAGATYYSDEYAVLDAQGRVWPYARQLSLRQPDSAMPRRCSPEEFGSQAGTDPLPVALVALTRYKAGARWHPRALSPGQAVLQLVEHTVPIQSHPERALTALQQLAPHARSFKGMRGEADETAAALLAEIER